MHTPRPSLERKSLTRRAFEHYLRTGRKYYIDRESPALVQKNNPYHDPDNGQFTSGPGGATTGGDKRPRSNTAKPTQNSGEGNSAEQSEKDKFKSSHPMKEVFSLVADSESGAKGSAAISDGKGDPGGASYGTFQFNTRDSVANDFVAENYMQDFQGADGKPLRSGTPEFDTKWREVVEREGEKFTEKERAFAEKEYFNPAVVKVEKQTKPSENEDGYNIAKASLPVQQALISTAIQQGENGGPRIVSQAVRETEKTVKRDADGFEEKLIENIYVGRTNQLERNISSHMNKIRENEQKIGSLEKSDKNKEDIEKERTALLKDISKKQREIRSWNNVIKGRYKNEPKKLIKALKDNKEKENAAG